MNLLLSKTHVFSFSIALFFTYIATAQVGINTTTPSPDAMLDISSSDKGLLIPRVSIADLTTIAPITSGSSESLLVYNTNEDLANGITKGFYYWNGVDSWVNLTNFNIYDRDSSLAGNREVRQNGNTLQLSSNVGRNALTLRRDNNSTELGLAFRNSGNAYDAAILMQSGTRSGLAIATGGNESNVNDLTNTVVFQNDNTTSFKGDVGVYNDAPQEAIHVFGTSNTIRVESLNTANNANNIASDPSPVYVDNSGNLTLEPPLTQTYMPIKNVDFISPGVTMRSRTINGGLEYNEISLHTRSITLNQASLVFINYQFSVSVSNQNNRAITDGAPRLFRSSVSVNGDQRRIAYDTGTYTTANNSFGNVTYASGNYYLSASAYVQLPAGTHDIELFAEGFGGDFEFTYVFGQTNNDLFQVVVQR